jgi:nitrogen fixation NifU-like protein
MERLYDSVIRRHNSQPYHYEPIAKCHHHVQAHNFICGDRFDLCIQIEHDVITSIYFHGLGCAVSKASASVLAQNLEGKNRREALQVCDQFLRVLKREIQAGEKLYSNDFESFGVVHEIQARYDCAALAWVEVEKFLNQ